MIDSGSAGRRPPPRALTGPDPQPSGWVASVEFLHDFYC